MRFVLDAGLWSTGAPVGSAPLDAVLEVSGAVLAWTVDDPDVGPRITFTDPVRADWLWRIAGDAGHVAVLAALEGAAGHRDAVDVTDAELDPAAVAPLRRLAFGHWLRRWWPASARDGIPALDAALLDAEIAVLTAANEHMFSDDTLDSDIAAILSPHTTDFATYAGSGDRRVAELAGTALEMADDIGCAVGTLVDSGPARRSDYALAAGAGPGGQTGSIAEGIASVHWAAVPPGVFDAADNTVEWTVRGAAPGPVIAVRVATMGPGDPAGVRVRLHTDGPVGVGVLDDRGQVVIPLTDAGGGSISESAAWNANWADALVTVGADVAEPADLRARVRRFAVTRLVRPGADAYLAEVLAAESQY